MKTNKNTSNRSLASVLVNTGELIGTSLLRYSQQFVLLVLFVEHAAIISSRRTIGCFSDQALHSTSELCGCFVGHASLHGKVVHLIDDGP